MRWTSKGSKGQDHKECYITLEGTEEEIAAIEAMMMGVARLHVKRSQIDGGELVRADDALGEGLERKVLGVVVSAVSGSGKGWIEGGY